MKQFLIKVNGIINIHAQRYSYPYVTFAKFGIITYPLYYWIWVYTNSQGYENLYLRLITVVLCLFLALKDFWSRKLQKIYSLYWYITVLYSLPLLFTFLLLKNHISTAYAMNTMTVLVLLILLLDLFALIIILILGVSLGIICFLITGGALSVPTNYVTIVITYGSILFFGSIFSYRKEQLKEAEKVMAQLKTQEQFVRTANQVAHDIRSPLASLLMITKSCTDIPEDLRISLRTASIRIGDIANNLLHQYRTKDSTETQKIEEKLPVLVSAALLESLTEKKFQYQHLPLCLEPIFHQEGQFAFIQIEPSAFQRMISNLINNAVEAFEGEEGIIIVRLAASPEWVKINIEDNGKGIAQELVEKLRKNLRITSGKSKGHGLGLIQVYETLERNYGQLKIDSTVGKGSEIMLEFPRLPTPHWCAEEIHLHATHFVLILDDDPSIHSAWDMRFEAIVQASPTIEIRHFQLGLEIIDFIKSLPEARKKDVLLLTDFELLQQPMHGLDIVEQTKVAHSILVTSHYAKAGVQEQAAKLGTKLLPKQLASEIPIFLEKTVISCKTPSIVDAVIVDDAKEFIDTLKCTVFLHYQVDVYYLLNS